MLTRDSFVRIDDEYERRPKQAGANQDPATLQCDSANYTLSSTNFASARGSVKFGDWQVEVFRDNLLDARTITNRECSINSPVPGTHRRERDFTFRRPTFGQSFIYRSK